MKLFLTSSFSDVSDLLPDFENNLQGKTVTFIPTASKVEEYTLYVDEGKQALEAMGMVVSELDVSTASRDEIATKLQANDFIYVTGGNTFYLLQELKRSGADQLIQEQVKAEKLYIGESAGAIITSPNIEYIQKMDEVEKAPDLDSFAALHFVDFYVLPHYKSEPFVEVSQEIKNEYENKQDLVAISNEEALLVLADGTFTIKS